MQKQILKNKPEKFQKLLNLTEKTIIKFDLENFEDKEREIVKKLNFNSKENRGGKNIGK